MEPTKTELTNPSKTQTHMTAPVKKGVKMVKLMCLREFMVSKPGKDHAGKTISIDRIVKPGELVDVTEHQAADLCRKNQGGYSFSGERHNADGDVSRHDLTRARRATQRDLVKDEPIKEEEYLEADQE